MGYRRTFRKVLGDSTGRKETVEKNKVRHFTKRGHDMKALMFIQKRIIEGPRKSEERPTNEINEGPSKCCKTTHNRKPVSEDNNGASMSEKCLGKQKATESEDEIEEDFENNSD